MAATIKSVKNPAIALLEDRQIRGPVAVIVIALYRGIGDGLYLFAYYISRLRFRVEYLRNSIRSDRWTRWYRTLLRASTGNTFKNISRHIGAGGSLVYKTTKEILADSPDNFEKYFNLVKLPGRSRRGAFMNFGFKKAVDNVLRAWRITFRGVTQGIDITSFIKDWNLDTGIVNGSSEKTFWA